MGCFFFSLPERCECTYYGSVNEDGVVGLSLMKMRKCLEYGMIRGRVRGRRGGLGAFAFFFSLFFSYSSLIPKMRK